MRTSIVSLIVILFSLYIIWFSNDNSLHPIVRRLHPKSFAAPGFESVRAKYEQLINSSKIRGSSFSVYYKGKLVVDLMGGASNLDGLRLWNPDSLGLVFSVSKALAGFCVALMVQRGELKYEDLVSKYWPEFGKYGKENVTIEMLMTHRAGVQNFGGEFVTISEIRENARRVSLLIEEHRPAPGDVRETRDTDGIYHILTYGLLVDQLVRRVDSKHRSLAQYFTEEIAQPLQLNIYPAITPELFHRFARIEPPPSFLLTLWLGLMGHYRVKDTVNALLFRLVMLWQHGSRWMDGSHSGVGIMIPESCNNVDEDSVPLFSYSVVASSRELARLFQFLALGGSLNGVKLFDRDFLEKYLLEPICALDLSPKLVKFARAGFISLVKPTRPALAGFGFGGQMAVADPSRALSYAYITNHLPGPVMFDPVSFELVEELELALSALESN